jgi:long-chain acyl-CoA synthetase
MSYDIDNTTLALLAVLASLLIYHRFFSTPSPLVHPLLLGKQSDVSTVRKKNETGVYRSFATGQGSPVSSQDLVMAEKLI